MCYEAVIVGFFQSASKNWWRTFLHRVMKDNWCAKDNSALRELRSYKVG